MIEGKKAKRTSHREIVAENREQGMENREYRLEMEAREERIKRIGHCKQREARIDTIEKHRAWSIENWAERIENREYEIETRE